MIAPTTTLLAYIPSPPQGVWHLGPLPLRAYALCIIVGIIVAVWWGDRRWIARGGQPGEVLDIAIWAVPFGLIGGRIYHVLTDWQIYFGDGGKSPIDVIRIWDGGLGIWGAVAFGALGAWIGARRHGIKLPAFGDAIAPAILLAQAIGRLGNYFNQELYGRPTTVPWGLEIYERSDGFRTGPNLINGTSTGQVYAVVHPTFLYELVWNLLIVVLLVVVDRKFRIGHGRLFALYVAGYCVGRFGVELLRSDTAYTFIAGIRINVFTSAVLFVAAAIYLVLAPKGREQGLEVYRHDRAGELEALGVIGYVDDRDHSGAEDASTEVEAADVDTDEPREADGEMADSGDDATDAAVIAKGLAEHDIERAVDPALAEPIAEVPVVAGADAQRPVAGAPAVGSPADDESAREAQVDEAQVDQNEPFDADGEMTDAGDDATDIAVLAKGEAEHDDEQAVDPARADSDIADSDIADSDVAAVVVAAADVEEAGVGASDIAEPEPDATASPWTPPGFVDNAKGAESGDDAGTEGTERTEGAELTEGTEGTQAEPETGTDVSAESTGGKTDPA